jgi:hypothetical protein
MKKLRLLAVLALMAIAGIYVQSAIALSEGGANNFLNELEDISMRGEGDKYCASLHEDMRASISDHSAEPPAEFEGGKKEFCAYVTYATKGLSMLGASTHAQRDEFTVQRSWLHPWTADVSYVETRTTSFAQGNVSIRTESEDRWTRVETFGGIKVKRLDSKTRLLK